MFGGPLALGANAQGARARGDAAGGLVRHRAEASWSRRSRAARQARWPEVGAPKQMRALLDPLPVRCAVGRRTGDRAGAARRAGYPNARAISRAPTCARCARRSASARPSLIALARGEDDRPVEADREAKSYGEENTFERDIIASARSITRGTDEPRAGRSHDGCATMACVDARSRSDQARQSAQAHDARAAKNARHARARLPAAHAQPDAAASHGRRRDDPRGGDRAVGCSEDRRTRALARRRR